MITTEQIKEVQTRVEALEGYLSIVEKRSLVQQEEKQTHEPTFWNNVDAMLRIWKIRARKHTIPGANVTELIP